MQAEKVTKQQKIGVLMGGLSEERDVSLVTGRACLAALLELGYNAIAIDVTRNITEQLQAAGIEVAFLALHGPYGEDGTIQGLLEYLGIPYTGTGVLGSAMAMDKITSKRMAVYAGIPTPRFQVLHKKAWEEAGSPALNGIRWPNIEDSAAENGEHTFPQLRLPLVAKAPLQGSSIGVYIIREDGELVPALEKVFQLGEFALLEEFIEGKEATVGILNGRALPSIEIVPAVKYYDYEAKYTSDATQYLIPPSFSRELQEEMQALSLRAYGLFNCRGACRVDFRVSTSGMPFFLEINTIPGMTSHSLIPKAAKAIGISFQKLVEQILQGEMPQNDPHKNNVTGSPQEP